MFAYKKPTIPLLTFHLIEERLKIGHDVRLVNDHHLQAVLVLFVEEVGSVDAALVENAADAIV